MKKLLSFTLALLTALSLAACANPDPVGDDTAADTSGNQPAAGSTAETDLETTIGTVEEKETIPADAFTHDWPVRILVRQSTSFDIKEGANADSRLTAALADRDAVMSAAWSSAPIYTVSNTVDLNRDALSGEDNFDLCLFRLSEALNVADKSAYELNDFDLHLDSQVWEQGLNALTYNGRILVAAPAAGVGIGDGTYAVFYDPDADGGALKDKAASLDGWTWEQMAALEAASAQGMNFGDRALSALLIAGGFRLTSENIYEAEDYMTPIIDYAASGKVVIPNVVQGSPFASGGRVFSVGKLSWLYDTANKGTYDRVTVLPLPKQSADQPNRTTSFSVGCLFIPGTVNRARTADCAAAMYLFALATDQTVKDPYLNQLIPAGDTVSRRNAEALFAARAYDFTLSSATAWNLTDTKSLKTTIGTKRQEYKAAITRWERYSKSK